MLTKKQLSVARLNLLEVLQGLNFGRIEDLRIADGEPIFIPGTRVIKEIKILAEKAARPELQSQDFVLRNEYVSLFDHLTQLGDGIVRILEVRHSLPFKLEIERDVQTDRESNN